MIFKQTKEKIENALRDLDCHRMAVLKQLDALESEVKKQKNKHILIGFGLGILVSGVVGGVLWVY